ncbi:MAG: hypothetical protein M1546_19950 [Chloroflexi bacterium]|nr:hypothetical protein [Chloroflexota bacterium]
MAKSGDLTPQQLEAIEALLATRNIKQAAEYCEMPYSTLQHWMDDPEFMAAYADAKEELREGISRMLTSTVADAVERLHRMVNGRNQRLALAACRVVLSAFVNVTNLAEFESRLKQLEDRRNGRT